MPPSPPPHNPQKPPPSDAGETNADDSTGTPHAEGEADEIPPYGIHYLQQIP
ncbi:hypothetical protein [Streptomyces rochei]|uniref:hypothetical protein n=1 Tax=Streptomyces rochei TaxID=1928 RepID=UPI0037A70371